MDLRQRLLSLVSPIALGSEVIAGVVLERTSIELGLRLSFRVAGETDLLHVEVSPADTARRWAARTERLAFSYRGEWALGKAVCDAVAEVASRNEDRVLDAVGRNDASTSRIREIETDQLLEPAGEGDGRHYGASPYVGCLIGCRFCYAQSRTLSVRRILGLPDVPWGSYVEARMNAAAVLEGELRSLPRRPIKFCPIVSDPYHAIEEKLGLTRACLEVLTEQTDWPVMLLTRSVLARRDLDVMERIPRLWLGVSLPTVDEETRAHFEPRAAAVEERLALLAEARERGLRTFAVVQPLLRGSIAELAKALCAHVDSVSIDVLRGVESAADDFDDPRYRETTSDAWQRDARAELEARLEGRVPTWSGELPPELRGEGVA